MIYFGPAGTSDNMKALGVKQSTDAPRVLSELGLNAYEYQCGKGVTISAEKASEFGKECAKYGIRPSVHSPYFISLSSVEEEKRLNSVNYILQTARIAKAMGAERIVVHSGSCAKMTREAALLLASDTLRLAENRLTDEGLESISICPETMGKQNQLGDLNEVMTLCGVDESFIPCIDFGHLNARTMGGIKEASDYAVILNTMQNALGYDRMKHFHCHFSKIEYTSGGEKKHLTFEDTFYGPEFSPLAEELLRRSLEPVIICESDNTMDGDALKMKTIYNNLKEGI